MEKFDNDRFFFKNINRSDTGASVMGWGEKSLARLSNTKAQTVTSRNETWSPGESPEKKMMGTEYQQ